MKEKPFDVPKIEHPAPSTPGTFEVTYKTGPEAQAPSKTEVVLADSINTNKHGYIVFEQVGVSGAQLRFPAERLVSMERLQNAPPYTDFLHDVQREFLDSENGRILMWPRQRGATFCLAATALDRAYNGSSVLYVTTKMAQARMFTSQALHEAAMKMDVDISHQSETRVSVGGTKIWAGSYESGETVLHGIEPDVLLCDNFSFAPDELQLDIFSGERAYAATGGSGVFGPDSALRRALLNPDIEDVYWYSETQMDANTDAQSKLPTR